MSIFNRDIKSIATVWFVCTVLIILTYSALLFVPYAFHDNTRYFREYRSDPATKASCHHDTQFVPLQKMGRPLTALIECAITTHVDSLEQLQRVRWLNILFAGTAFALLVLWFLIIEFSMISAFAIATSLFTLPALQNNLFMTSIQTQLALALATLSYMVMPNPLRPTSGNSRRRYLLGLSLLGMSFFLYYVYSFIIILLNLSLLLWGKTRDSKTYFKTLLRDLILLGGFSFAVLASVGLGLNRRDPSMGGYSATVELTTLVAKFKQLLFASIPTALNLWNIYTSKFITFAIIAFLIGGLAIQFKKKNLPLPVLLYLFALSLIFGSCCVFILATPLVDYILFRTLFLISCFIILIGLKSADVWARTFLSLEVVPRVVTGFAVVLATIGLVSAAVNTNRNVINAVVELGFVQTEIERQFTDKTERIHFVQADTHGYGFNGYRSAGPDEFNNNTTQYPMFDEFGFFARLALLQFRPGTSFRLQECNDSQQNCLTKRETGSVVVTYNRPGEVYLPSLNTVVIDMNILGRAVKHRN